MLNTDLTTPLHIRLKPPQSRPFKLYESPFLNLNNFIQVIDAIQTSGNQSNQSPCISVTVNSLFVMNDPRSNGDRIKENTQNKNS